MVDLILTISIFLHLIATVLWIGGLVIFNVLVVPSVQRYLEPPIAGKLMGPMGAVARKIFYIGVVLFLVSGSLMTIVNQNYEGLLNFGNAWSQAMLVKHILVGILIVLAVYHHEILIPKQAKLAGKPSKELEKVEKQLKLAGIAALILVFVILLLTAIASAITSVQ
jgi:uncharacterized membrane protein